MVVVGCPVWALMLVLHRLSLVVTLHCAEYRYTLAHFFKAFSHLYFHGIRCDVEGATLYISCQIYP